MSHQFLHEARIVQQRAEALSALCNEHGYAVFLVAGMTWRGWALAEQGQAEEGIQQIQQGIVAARAMGIEIFRPHLLTLLAEAYGKTGQVEEGLHALAEALTLVEKNGERMYEAELYRLRGELTLQQEFKVQGSKFKVENPQSPFRNPQLEAEECFLKAMEISQRQQAKSWNSAPPRAWLACGNSKAKEPKLTRCYPRSTAGSPKDLIPKTCKRPRRCWTNWRRAADGPVCRHRQVMPLLQQHGRLTYRALK